MAARGMQQIQEPKLLNLRVAAALAIRARSIVRSQTFRLALRLHAVDVSVDSGD